MEKSKEALTTLIRKAAFPDELSTAALRLSVAKNVFSLAAAVYFCLYLFAVGGLWKEPAEELIPLFFPAFLLAACALTYELANYFIRVKFEKFAKLRYAAFGLCVAFFVVITMAHFGMFR